MTDSSLEKKWYALHVYSGQEKKVVSYIENEVVRLKLEERVSNILLPQETIMEMKNGKKVEKQKYFFPGYILVEMALDKETTYLVLNTPGVINFLGSQNNPQVIHPTEIERIIGRTIERDEMDVSSVPFKVGDSVKVVDGPFNEFTGFIEEINPEKNKVKVMVSIFGRATPVELDFLQVEQEK
jgi:transcriptional antiterminator NusG